MGEASAKQASAARFRAALRCAVLRRERPPDFGLFDRWSWLSPSVFFCALSGLAAMGASPPSLAAPEPVAAPSTNCLSPMHKPEDIVVLVSKTRILVGDDPETVVPLPPHEQLVASGVDAKYKRSGPNDMLLVPLWRQMTRAREPAEAPCPVEAGGQTAEAIVVMDATTPYRLMVEVLFTLGQSGIARHHLMVRTGKKEPRTPP
jgi:hypothetical protein